LNATQYKKLSKTTDSLFDAIPTDYAANIAFRKDLHTFLLKDDKAKLDFYAKAFVDPRIMFNAVYWCPATESKALSRNLPFILYPHQKPAVLEIKQAFDEGYDLIIDKSRKQGATFLLCGMGLLYWLISPGFQMLWGSRVESLVDTSATITKGMVVGDEKSIFYKMLYLLSTLPPYLVPDYEKNHLLLQNLENGASHAGSTTNIEFGKGSRATVIAVDELAAMEPKIAQRIIENIADTARCCIFNSTQGDYGSAHPYDKMLVSGAIKKVILDWTDNPNQNAGLYDSPEPGKIRIFDVDYYKARYPGVFDGVSPGETVDVESVDGTYPFVADGGATNFSCKRSVWYDTEERRPGRTRRGMAQNVLRIPSGSSDLFFRYDLIQNLLDGVKEPRYRGDVVYEIDSENRLHGVSFQRGGSNSKLSWWGRLINSRPDQSHTYTVGCDLSRGTGASNSVAAVLDINTREIVGLLVTPYLRLEKFAEQVVALCEWVGGIGEPLLIWEENGASEFEKRVEELSYYNLWEKPVKSKNRYGWRSTAGPNGTKIAVLNALEAALFEGLRAEPQFDSVVVYDEQSINEAASYVFYEGKVDVGPVTSMTDSSGAKAAHGDRVIAIALAVLAAKGQPMGEYPKDMFASDGSFIARMRAKQRSNRRKEADSKIWWY
jgi:hypothetical protein